ncbi:TPA: hypothetical protein DCP42_03150 [Patescibacteria group bacterium]|nr:hypothetical protein [Patescibacteria group bacterium]
MRINLSKKNKIIVIILLVLVFGGTGGYLLWRVNQDKTVAPTDSEAGCIAVGTESCRDYEGSCDESRGLKGCGSDMGPIAAGHSWCQTYRMECTSECGDGTCSSDENATSCPKDCAKCGDDICSSTESLELCPEDCSVCGDNKCTGTETATTCESDCACKALVWSSKPSGEYKLDDVTTATSSIVITNPNSTSDALTGITMQFNGSTLAQCGSSATGNCFNVGTDTTGKQKVTLNLFDEAQTVTDGTYDLSISLPGPSTSCVETATFTVAEDAVVVVVDEVPDTGLFDGVMSKIYLGSGFVFLGLMTTQFSKLGYMFNIIGERNRVVLEEKKRKREEDKRNRFERRFK